MAEAPQRGGVRDQNIERAAQTEKVRTLQQVDSFAPERSTVFGDTTVRTSPLLEGLAKFGTKLGMAEMEKTAKANFLAGQTMRSSGEAMAEGLAPPTRRGFKAMDAKIKTDTWYNEQKQLIDSGENGTDPLAYAQEVSQRVKGMLTGDRETDNMITEAAMPLVQDLGRYQANANIKRRRADALTQSTADISGGIRSVQGYKNNGDQVGERDARSRLISSLSLPNIADPELRQQQYADMAAIALDMGDPTVLNYVRENEIQFNPAQERSVLSAKKRYTANEKGKLNTVYQHDLADLEAGIADSATLLEMRENTASFQEKYPTKNSNRYYASLENSWRASRGKKMYGKVNEEAYYNGEIESQAGMSPKTKQETARAVEQQIEQNPTLTAEEKATQTMELWSANNSVSGDRASRWDAGMTNAFKEDGTLLGSFEEVYSDFSAHYAKNPDLAMRTLSAENRLKFGKIRNLSELGGMELRDAAALVRTNKENAKDLTPDERTKMSNELDDAVDNVMGKGFFNTIWGTVTSAPAVKNEGMVRSRIKRLADTYMQTGYPDAESATEAARIKIMESHEQVGDALIYNGGTSLAKWMGVADKDVPEAVEFQKEQILLANPDFDADNVILMGDPVSGSLMFANLNENDIISDVVSVDMKAAGAAYSDAVVKPRKRLQAIEMDAADQNRERKVRLYSEAVESDIYTESEAEAGLSNWLGSFVIESRMADRFDSNNPGLRAQLRDKIIADEGLENDVSAGGIVGNRAASIIDTFVEEQMQVFRDDNAEFRARIQQKEMNDNGIDSDEDYHKFKIAKDASTRQNTPAQNKMIADGKTDEYQRSLYPNLPTKPNATSADTFVPEALEVARAILGDSNIFPEVAVAISGQETGWGSAVKGGNYHGIKGEGQKFTTHEVIDGERQKWEDESFKVYGDYIESTQGLRNHLNENPRFHKALEASTPEEQIRLLHEAVYATDPTWADSLINIISQPRFK